MKRSKLLATFTCILVLSTFGAFYACKDSNSVDSSPHSSYSQSDSLPDSFDAPPVLDNSSIVNDSNSSSSSHSSSSNSSSANNSSNSSSSSNDNSNVSVSKTQAQYIRLTGNNVNVRSGAGTNYSVIGSAEKGETLAVVEKTGNWYKTYYKNKTAYVYASYATVFTLEKTKKTAVEEVIEEGYKLLGTPYVYGAVRYHDGNGKLLGGFSAQKFDCSSLIQYIFYKGAGKVLNTTTRTQVKQGKYVAPDNLQRGDCIFFTNEDRQHNTGIERVGHVALYLGNNYILHTASDYARIEKMSATRWNYYIEARRFL